MEVKAMKQAITLKGATLKDATPKDTTLKETTLKEAESCIYEKVYFALWEMGQRYSEFVQFRVIGRSHDDRMIPMFEIGKGERCIFCVSGLEGGDGELPQYLLQAASRLYDPLSGAMTNMAELFNVDLQVDRLKAIQNYPEENGVKKYHTNGYDITFDHVGFSYEQGKQVLKDVSFTAKQGQVTALVGPSGGGKSTVANLAAGFYDVDNGRITLGGTDIAPIDSTVLMKDFSVVFQNVVLFNNTVMENIRVGRKDATDEDVMAAAKAAHCHEFIMKLPNGYQTVIGENGSTLSGGECQRLSIARALLKDAPVILLDEATASLDVDNETEIQEAITHLIRGKTVLIIAHRMRTVEKADKIIVLDGGVIAESGTHEELMRKNGLYHKLVELQTAAADWKLQV